MKVLKCPGCKEEKTLNNFHKNAKQGKRCKPCYSVYKKEYYQRPDVKKKERKYFLHRYFKRTYGITYEEYQKMFLNQNGKCAICNKEKDFHDFRSSKRINLSVDHCHASGKVRGLLCISCNHGLGCFNDDLSLFEKAMKYIEKHK